MLKNAKGVHVDDCIIILSENSAINEIIKLLENGPKSLAEFTDEGTPYGQNIMVTHSHESLCVLDRCIEYSSLATAGRPLSGPS